MTISFIQKSIKINVSVVVDAISLVMMALTKRWNGMKKNAVQVAITIDVLAAYSVDLSVQ